MSTVIDFLLAHRIPAIVLYVAFLLYYLMMMALTGYLFFGPAVVTSQLVSAYGIFASWCVIGPLITAALNRLQKERSS